MRAGLLLIATLLLGATAASGAETGGCGRFAWPIDEDRAAITAAGLREAAVGESITVSPRAAVRLRLTPTAEAKLDQAPERAPKPGTFAGLLRWRTDAAGPVQVTVSSAVWIDLIQDGRALKPIGFSGVTDCEGARKSVRFEVASGVVVLQVSGAPEDAVAIAVGPVR